MAMLELLTLAPDDDMVVIALGLFILVKIRVQTSDIARCRLSRK